MRKHLVAVVVLAALALLAARLPEADALRVASLRTSEILGAEVEGPAGARSLGEEWIECASVRPGDAGELILWLDGVRVTSPSIQSDDLDVHGLARRSLIAGLRAVAAERGLALRVEGELWPSKGGMNVLVTLDEQGFGMQGVSGDGSVVRGRLDGWRPPERSALWPPLVAIALAVLLRKPVLALFAGVWCAAFLLRRAGGEGGAVLDVARALPDVVSDFFVPQLVDPVRLQIMGFVLAMLAMVGVMTRGGGIRGLMDLVARMASNARRTQIATWLMGLVVFFDDYANCILVGTTMRPLTDRFRIAREKLAYLVDSTAAPVAGLSIFSTWIAFEVSTFSAQLPAAGLAPSEGYAVFLQTLPFRFYCLLTLVMSCAIAFSGRDFGPMLTAERRARRTGQVVRAGGRPMVSDAGTHLEPFPGAVPRARNALLPLAVFIGLTLLEIVRVGWVAMRADDPELAWTVLFSLRGVTTLLGAGESTRALLIGSAAGLLVSTILGVSAHRSKQLLTALGLLAGSLLVGWVGIRIVDLTARYAQEYADSLRWVLTDDIRIDVAAVLGTAVSPAFRTAVMLLFAIGAVSCAPSPLRRTMVGAAWTTVRSMGVAIAILYLAWMIGAACDALGTAPYLTALVGDNLPSELLPAILFGLSAVVAFATGSSWSTMSILLPLVVGMAFSMGEQTELGGHLLMVMSIGAVLEGSIFGDHCSPLSDTTVLSSTSSASDHIDHVRTQAPYAVVVMLVALTIGYLPCAFSGAHPLLSLAGGAALLLAIVFLLGKRADDPHSAA
ncbi:MAG TPA: Na+/H+ antiporter NhaC family protein [Planctomycetota bacterium]|nr:Na+/H+ antiporter NhaC family protein [Planctomycetota bacterium]